MLVIALFIIIVLGALAVAMTRLTSGASQNVIYEVLSLRALNTARTGIEFCLARQYPLNNVVSTPCSDSTAETASFDDIAGLENCRYSVQRQPLVTATDAGQNYEYSSFTSTGTCEAGDIVVTRTVYIDSLVRPL
jgi:MSHA biogenesis protein MshP